LNEIETSMGDMATPYAKKSSQWGCLVLFLVVVGCESMHMLSSLLLPSVQAAREAARQGSCANNLRQIGLAMQAYHTRYGCLPPAFIPDENGKPKHSWRVLILPFLDREKLFRQYRFDEPWNSPNNLALECEMPRIYRCPSEGEADQFLTSYAMIVGPHAISDGRTSHKLGDVKQKGANTILLAEAANAGIKWLEPRDLNVSEMKFDVNGRPEPPYGSKSDIASAHPGLAKALMCDGTVRDVNSSVDQETLKAMLRID
jgi:hypothetical protein